MPAFTRHPFFLLLALIAVVTLIALPTTTYPLGRDQGEFATIGRGILDGRVPYVDLWNPKPPAVFYIYGLVMAVFGRTSGALRAIDLFIYPPIAAALYWIGRRIANVRVGLWAALLFGVFYFSETFWTLTQNDGIALLSMTLAVVCAIKSADTGRSLWAFVAGCLTVYAIWFKYPFALFAAAVVFAYLRIRRASPRWRDALAFAAGGLLVGGGGIAYMMAIGAWDALVESARVTASYTAQGMGDFGGAMVTALGFRWLHWGALFALALFGLVIAVRRLNRQSLWWIVGVWLVVGSAIMLVQLKFYDYHWLPMLPPLALIGASTIEAIVNLTPRETLFRQAPLHDIERGLENRLARFFTPSLRGGEGDGGEVARPYHALLRGIIAILGLAALAAVVFSRTLPYLAGREDQGAYYSHFQAGEFVADESLEVANYLRARVVPGDSLFIWGFRPEVYYLSGLNPAVRFIFQFPLVAAWYPPEWRQQTVDILWAALPPYVLVLQVDYMPWVTGSDDDSNTLLQGYTELNNWLEFNYERDTQIGNFFLWRRISKPK